MSEHSPKVTVLMPVFNGEAHLREAIESILEQTFTDFEFLIINDGSTDKSVEIIESYRDPRIRLVHNPANLKLIATLNKGLELARGEFIARMDCDDISLPERLTKQVTALAERPEVAVCGTWLETFGETSGEWHYPTEPDQIKAHLFFHSALAHPSVMLRYNKLKQFNLHYDPEHPYAEDFGLWQKCSLKFDLINIPEVLLKYRVTSTSLSRANKEKQVKTLEKIYREGLRLLDIIPNQQQLDTHRSIALLDLPSDRREFLQKADTYLRLVHRTNQGKGAFPEPVFSEFLGQRWKQICNASQGLGFYTWLKLTTSPLSKLAKVPWRENVSFLRQCLKSRYGV